MAQFRYRGRGRRGDLVEGALEGMLATEQGGIGNRLTLLDDEIEGNLAATAGSCA